MDLNHYFAMSAPDDDYGYRARAASENRAYEPSADEDDEEDMCPARLALLETLAAAPIHPAGGAGTLGLAIAALKAHAAECAACGSTRKIVATDRELLDAGAVCCLAEVA